MKIFDQVVIPNFRLATKFLSVMKAVHKALKRYLMKLEPDDGDYLFKSRQGGNVHISVGTVNKLIKSWTRAINLSGRYGCASLRKTWGYLQRTHYGVGFEIIAKRFNHSSPAITMRYIAIQEKEVPNSLMNEISRKRPAGNQYGPQIVFCNPKSRTNDR